MHGHLAGANSDPERACAQHSRPHLTRQVRAARTSPLPAGPVQRRDVQAGLCHDLGQELIDAGLVIVGSGRLGKQVIADVEAAAHEVVEQVGAAMELAGPAVNEHEVEAGAVVGVQPGVGIGAHQ